MSTPSIANVRRSSRRREKKREREKNEEEEKRETVEIDFTKMSFGDRHRQNEGVAF